VVSIGSSSDGAHLARVKTADGAERELLIAILVDRGRVQLRVEAGPDAAVAWVQERAGRIREALEEAGLELADMDLGRRERDGGRRGRGGSRDRRR